MIPWFMQVFLAMPIIIIVVGVSWVKLSDGGRVKVLKLKKKSPKPIQQDFGLFLNTAEKISRHGREHRDWTIEFNALLIEELTLHVFDGELVTTEEFQQRVLSQESRKKWQRSQSLR